MTVHYTSADGVGEIVFDRPDKLNAFDGEMVEQMKAALDRAAGDDVGAVILRGEGRGFCAGRDIQGVDPAAEDAEAVIVEWFNPLVTSIRDLPVISIAAVHGACLGAGFGLAMACDLVYAATDAKFGSPFARLGAVPDSGAHHVFTRLLGPQRALELIVTGELISGMRAAELGLVTRAWDPEGLLDACRRVASQIATGPRLAFAESRRIIRRITDDGIGLVDVLADEAAAQGRASATDDYREGFAAFHEKRKPRFTGR